MRELSISQQRLRRNAADVQADSAPILLLHHCCAETELCRADSRGVPAWSCTEYDEIKVGGHGDDFAASRAIAPTNGRRIDSARKETQHSVVPKLAVMVLQPAATLRSKNGMVCAIDHLAAGAGVEMLRRGGSAADAAIATNAVLAVTSQHLCGMGGDLFAVVTPPGERPIVLNSSGRAGSGADPERLRNAGHSVMPFFDDIASVTVPGCVDGWIALHERFGRLEFAELLEPARAYAEEGFPASPTLVEDFAAVAGLEEAADYTADGPLHEGALIRRPGVARTLAAIAAGGRSAFYQGEFGEGLLRLGGGEFTSADLASPIAEWVDAISVEAFGARIWSAPPNSQGYLTLAGAFIASRLDLPDDPDSDAFAHLLVEASRQAAFDRLAVLAEGVSGASLLDPTELERRHQRIDPNQAATLGDHYQE